MRRLFFDVLSFVVLAVILGAVSCELGYSQTHCGRETKTATGYVRVQCLDYPEMRRVTGFTGFPNEKGQQVWIRSSDETIQGFKVTLRYRKEGKEAEAVQIIDRLPTYESGAGWVPGDVEILGVSVVELREAMRHEL